MKKLISLIAILFVFIGCSTQNLESSLESNSPLDEFYKHANVSAILNNFDNEVKDMKEKVDDMFAVPKQCVGQKDMLIDKMISLSKEFMNDDIINAIVGEGMKMLGEDNIAIINEVFKSDLGVRLESFLKKNNIALFNIDDSMYDESFSKADYDEFNKEIRKNIKVDIDIANAMADMRDKLADSSLFSDLMSKFLNGAKDEIDALEKCYEENE